jgi:hypothetical protein
MGIKDKIIRWANRRDNININYIKKDKINRSRII